jgi:DNA repair protein RecN (Recombination protein N)
MLLSLRIENFALIDSLELEFGTGLNVLTGETGAGKSIILDALLAALGEKCSSRAIRTGANRALVEATFELETSVAQWLQEQEIELLEGNILVCSRELVARTGNLRSRSRLNGVLVNRQLMSQLRDRLVEITAQGQTVNLGKPQYQLAWLDTYGGESVRQQVREVASAYQQYQQAQQTLDRHRRSQQERLQRQDWLAYQQQELSEANLQDPQELDNLQQEKKRLSHTVDLQQSGFQVYSWLYTSNEEAPSAMDLLAQAESTLQTMVQYDPQLQSTWEMVRDALTQVMEAGRQMGSYAEQLETDPQQLQQIEERIQELKPICRKYGPTLAEAIAHYQQVEAELEALTNSQESLEAREKQRDETWETLQTACRQLTQQRRQTANCLETELVNALKPLAMDKVQFRVSIEAIPPTNNGSDRVSFQFSPNPGEPLQPISEIASGGEMSRFLLALKACFAQQHASSSNGNRDLPTFWRKTLVFDEIDVGVSGKVAQAIAEKLHQLSRQHQVLCVTHQPLVAAMADSHFRINKQAIAADAATDPEERTVVRVDALANRQQRQHELAQLAGGQSAQEAIAFAESLLAQAANFRQTHPQNQNNASLLASSSPPPTPKSSQPASRKESQSQTPSHSP